MSRWVLNTCRDEGFTTNLAACSCTLPPSNCRAFSFCWHGTFCVTLCAHCPFSCHFLKDTAGHYRFVTQHSVPRLHFAVPIVPLLQPHEAKEMCHVLTRCSQTLPECCGANASCLCSRSQHSCWKTKSLVKMAVEDHIICFSSSLFSSPFPD